LFWAKNEFIIWGLVGGWGGTLDIRTRNPFEAYDVLRGLQAKAAASERYYRKRYWCGGNAGSQARGPQDPTLFLFRPHVADTLSS